MTSSTAKSSTLPGMGASISPDGKGVTFRVWAPHADQVYVAGNFTNPPWNEGKIPLAREGGESTYWSTFVPEAKRQDHYKFVICRKDEPDLWKLDPYCRQITGHVNLKDGSPQHNECVIIDPNIFTWDKKKFDMPSWNELVIYELHLGTFIDNGTGARRVHDAISKLDYLVDLGINAVEIMPCTEFETNTSMGYNPSLLFAIEDHYGKERGVQQFVNEANRRGIAVIFDVVYNHLGPDNLGDCFWRFDGWHVGEYGGIYFYQDDRALTDFGATRPDYGRLEVRQILRDNAMMWLHEFHADGLRLDSTVNIHRSRQGDIPDGWQLMQWINRDKHPDKITIAEDLEDNEWITKKVEDGGAGFGSQWDVAFYNVIRNNIVPTDDKSRSMSAVCDALNKRYNNDAFQRVIYSESHDEVTEQFGIKLGRMPEKIWPGNADSWPSRKRSTLAAAIVFTSPGVPMIFQVLCILEEKKGEN
jgi:1,4-alpha-glucan branching enzyme